MMKLFAKHKDKEETHGVKEAPAATNHTTTTIINTTTINTPTTSPERVATSTSAAGPNSPYGGTPIASQSSSLKTLFKGLRVGGSKKPVKVIGDVEIRPFRKPAPDTYRQKQRDAFEDRLRALAAGSAFESQVRGERGRERGREWFVHFRMDGWMAMGGLEWHF